MIKIPEILVEKTDHYLAKADVIPEIFFKMCLILSVVKLVECQLRSLNLVGYAFEFPDGEETSLSLKHYQEKDA